MLNTVVLDARDVPPHLRGEYSGRKFRAVVGETMSIPADAGLWSGGSRDLFYFIRLADGARVPAPGQNAAPWDRSSSDRRMAIEPGYAVVCHSIFCGKDSGLTFYVHPADATAMLPAPSGDLTKAQRIVLICTRSYKSSYAGMSDYRFQEASRQTAITRDDWESAKASLIASGHLNKAGAITTKGKNAIGRADLLQVL
jgi:hypothetical protein